MKTGFPVIGGHHHASIGGENSFWPSFTDVMMVITLIFLMATSLLVVRNWQLVAELQESIAAEQTASEIIEITNQENATLEERLTNAEQANSILRLRLLKQNEQLANAQARLLGQAATISALESQTENLQDELAMTQAELTAATLEIDEVNTQKRSLSRQIEEINQQLADQTRLSEKLRTELSFTRDQVAELTETGESQQRSIVQLTQEQSRLQQERSRLAQKTALLDAEIRSYHQQLATLQNDYDAVQAKYEELIKPSRSAQGKYIVEVYYVKSESGDVIRFRQPGQSEYEQVSLEETERRLDQIKAEQGDNLYVKIIIPQDSGLTYTEAWNFTRRLLVKYDYYYQ